MTAATLHGAAAAEVQGSEVRITCTCGWRTGWRQNRHGALQGLAGHLRSMTSMDLARAQRIVTDHVHGLHADRLTPDGSCTWIGCDDARRIVETDREARNQIF